MTVIPTNSYSCYVQVNDVKGEDYGAIAQITYAGGGGIDIEPSDFTLQVTEDAAQIVQKGARLKLTLEAT